MERKPTTPGSSVNLVSSRPPYRRESTRAVVVCRSSEYVRTLKLACNGERRSSTGQSTTCPGPWYVVSPPRGVATMRGTKTLFAAAAPSVVGIRSGAVRVAVSAGVKTDCRRPSVYVGSGVKDRSVGGRRQVLGGILFRGEEAGAEGLLESEREGKWGIPTRCGRGGEVDVTEDVPRARGEGHGEADEERRGCCCWSWHGFGHAN